MSTSVPLEATTCIDVEFKFSFLRFPRHSLILLLFAFICCSNNENKYFSLKIPRCETTRVAVEHEHVTNQASEQSFEEMLFQPDLRRPEVIHYVEPSEPLRYDGT